MKKALHGCERRLEQLNPLWVRYKVKMFESAAFLKAVNPRASDVRDLRWEADLEFAQKGKKRRSWGTRAEGSVWERVWWNLYNGKVSVEKATQQNHFRISKQPNNSFVWVGPPHVVARDQEIAATLRSWANNDGSVTVVRATNEVGTDKEAEMMTEWRFPKSNWGNKSWLLPERGWLCRRRESYNQLKQLNNATEITAYITVNGIVYPKQGFMAIYFPTGEVASRQEFEVTSVETLAASIPDSLFEFQFPKDSVIWDDDLKVFVRRSESSQTHLDEVISRVEGRSGRWHWWVAALIGSAAMACGVWWRLARRRKPPR